VYSVIYPRDEIVQFELPLYGDCAELTSTLIIVILFINRHCDFIYGLALFKLARFMCQMSAVFLSSDFISLYFLKQKMA